MSYMLISNWVLKFAWGKSLKDGMILYLWNNINYVLFWQGLPGSPGPAGENGKPGEAVSYTFTPL